MSLAAGSKLGPYEIVSAIGAGGMGEVYRARDTRLGREVAVKVLPESFAGDEERLRRFEQEARAVAALNHPNILAVHDVGAQDQAPYLVTELLEGETLRQRLRAGALPARKCIDFALQVARGLAAAHDKGIVHRDLKPENIFLSRNGLVKILDFGLAKFSRSDPASAGARAMSETAQTSPGTVLGTVGYMSPEQVRGLAVDHRSDIFSLGTILFEMLSGQRPFQGETAADLMSSILKEDPLELSAGARAMTPALERILRHCLEKEPAERFESARDLAFGLESLSGISGSAAASPAPPANSWSRRRMAFATAGTLALCLVAAGTWLLARATAGHAQPTFHQLTFQRGLIYAARFAPDGQTVYYSAAWNGTPLQLYSTNPSSPESRALDVSKGTLFAVSRGEMAISTGCRDLFFGACEGTLAVVPLAGGAPRALADNVVSADWNPEGTKLAAIRESGGKFRVEFPLGTTIFESDTWLNSVRVSPDGKAIAFIQYLTGTGDYGRALVLDTSGKEITRSIKSVSIEGLAWSPGGKEVWFGATKTHAWSNAIDALSLSGKERIVLRLPGMLRLHDIGAGGRVLLSKESWRTGLQYRGPADRQERDLAWLDAAVLSDISHDGRRLAFGEYGEGGGSALVAYTETVGEPPVKLDRGYEPMFSPDGKWVLVNAAASPEHLALLPTGAGNRQELEPFGVHPFWSSGWMPSGKEVYFVGGDGHNWRLSVQDLTGGKPRAVTPPLLVQSQADVEVNLVSPDGKLAFGRDLQQKGWLYPLAGGAPRLVPGLEAADLWVNWSSDGRAAYVYQNEKTHAQLFRLDLATGARRLIADLSPPDPAGLVGITPVRITADGKTYAYSYNRSLSDLYLTEGVR